MKVVILAGGHGTRLAEETHAKPKPMVEIGGQPILWHLMMRYSAYGFGDFVVAAGYKGEQIQEYFSVPRGEVGSHPEATRPMVAAPWKVAAVDTGLNTMTGGRVRRLASRLRGGPFMLTYGDGLSSVDLRELLKFHRSHGKIATMTAVRPPARFGRLQLDGDDVTAFTEKPADECWINGGFFVLEPAVLDYIAGDPTSFEREPLEQLAREGQLKAFRHEGFWQCMDTLRDKNLLEEMWANGNAPWKCWE